MENTNELRSMCFYEEWFNLMELGAEKFMRFMELLKQEQFDGVDIKPEEIDDIVLRSIWRQVRPVILKRHRNRRYYSTKQENIKSDNLADMTDYPADVPNVEIEDEKVPIPSKEEIETKFLLRNFRDFKAEAKNFQSHYRNANNSPKDWNELIKAWTPQNQEMLLHPILNRFLKGVYKRAVANGDRETEKMMRLHMINYTSDNSILTIRCPQDCITFWQRNITPDEMKPFGRPISVKYELAS